MKATQYLTSTAQKPMSLWILAVIISLIIYIPLLLNGGISTDDWGDILLTQNCAGVLQCYGDWLSLFPNRPLAPLPLLLATKIFSTHYSWYLLANSTIYLAALGLCTNIFAPFLRSFSRILFFILAATPCIALPLIVSPINQMTATVAFLYWAISLKLLLLNSPKHPILSYGLSYLFLLCAFLTYEIILPLLIFTAFLPAFNEARKNTQYWVSYFLKYICPILATLIVVMVWQKALAPQFFEDVSRLNFNPANISRNLYTWITVYTFQLPNLFLKSFTYFSYQAVLIFLLIGILFCFGVFSEKKSKPNSREIWFLTLSLFSWFSSSLIFILTDESAVSWGYQARGLSSTWICFTILIACLTQTTYSLRSIWRVLCLIIIYLLTSFSIFSFCIQRDKYIESWNLQIHILRDAISLMDTQKIGPNASILANVPRYVPNNYNRELVYSQSWDFPAALMLNTKDQVRGGIVIDSRGKDLQNLRIKGDIAMVNDHGKVDFNNLWLYDFEPATNQGSLTRLKNVDELQLLITSWKK
jgi:hypothetical protein